ncbi:MAG: LLM class flavin-dependent oxidoreductase [Xanthobacteraceae bacterium]|nr:LLM class flavin-dependent oxidoreductase [Xanthobacteraceae bacterium]
MAQHFEFGLDTFGDITTGPDGRPLTHAQVIRNVIDEAVLADQVGVDAFGVGEHHRPDFAVSAPEVVLGAIAGRTKRIRLGSAVTVLSSDDPIRVFERFSTLNAASNGRAEVTVGRGSFIESFPLFGYNLAQYEELFEEKLDLFVALLRNDTVTWQGKLRPPLKDQRIFPPIEAGPLRTWVGVGGSPESVVRAAHYDLPLALAIIGGDPARFKPYVDLYHRAFAQFGKPVQPIAVHSPGHVADTDAQAREDYWIGYKAMHDKIGAERGWPPMGRGQFDTEVEHGALHIGAPETVARKIAATAKALGIVRFDMKYSAGTLPHDKMMRSIELYGTKVMPLVREMLAEKVPAA